MEPATGLPIAALEALPIAVAMRKSLWLYPIVEITHIAGFVTLVGSIIVLDLRLLGLSRALPVSVLTRHTVPWSAAALLVIVPTGLLMFSAHATDFLTNGAFQLKLMLILLAGINAGIFHTTVYRSVSQWDRDVVPPTGVRLHAAASLLLWLGVISCGRLLAYV